MTNSISYRFIDLVWIDRMYNKRNEIGKEVEYKPANRSKELQIGGLCVVPETGVVIINNL
jgi:hypothetical protein